MKFVKKCSATVLAVSMLMTCAAASACAHSHDYKWRYNTEQHWKECEADGFVESGSISDHSFEGTSTCDCGYIMGTEIENPPATPTPDDPNNPDNPNVPAPTPGVTHTVTFVTNTTQTYDSQSVSSGSTVSAPTGLTNGGKYLAGWYTTQNFAEGTAFNFSTAVTKDYTLYAKWIDLNAAVKEVKAYNESLAIEWQEANPSAATVQYKPVSGGNYVTVDKELIRPYNDGARVDIIGLKAGSYSVKITPSSGTSFDIPEVSVSAYDRSGYAHFNYTNGVGAYNDDGTLKDNAIVIYVTDENKDYVMRDVAAANPAVTMFKIPTYAGTSGTDWKNKNADGIGWWLNNSQYTMDNKNSDKNKRPSNTYDAANGKNLGFKLANESHPIVIRFIGTVTTPEGCTKFNSEDEGGSVGDNGNMARMKNYKNITLEGIGEDTVIQGWGFHFISGTDGTNGQGSGFEVRNLTFNEYPEDAVGMEGQQSGTTITAAVSRCWIHHNTFFPGRCDSPAESDKKEGDGSCDFKRGEYFTASYNYFEYCHKTNLVGSSDSSMQFNMTYHHNMWYQCGSRIPLTRHANVHFYNNYVCGDTTEKTTPYSHIAKPSLSYVHSLRAQCYIFTEGNYYEGSKNITEGKTGGDAKGWNNMFYANIGVNNIVNATSREQIITNHCANNSIDYGKFDTNPAQFYYDAAKKKSDCLLDDPVAARLRVLREAGANGFTPRVGESMIKDADKPAAALNIPEDGLTVDLSKATVGGTVSGVKFVNAKNSSGTAKGKGMLATFTVVENTEITLKSSGMGITGCELVKADGTVIAGGIASYTGFLQPGTYFISSSQKDKDGGITSLFFKQGVTEAERIQNVIDYINAIGEVSLTQDCESKIEMAQTAYNALTADQKAKVTNASTLTAAVEKYDNLAATSVINLINAIGTVNQNSGDKILAAQEAYNALSSSQKGKVTNRSTLTAALEQWSQFAVKSVNDQITALADVSTISVTDQTAIANARAAY
ncbi:MAG: InlB B-repeat-containing protein, partial [Clostridia bacterium]|nr:InlB B-repeat-containing protein [Clostridia bacterium]